MRPRPDAWPPMPPGLERWHTLMSTGRTMHGEEWVPDLLSAVAMFIDELRWDGRNWCTLIGFHEPRLHRWNEERRTWMLMGET